MGDVRFCRKTNEFVGLDRTVYAKLVLYYEGVNIPEELKKMALWLMTKGKDRKGTLTFITNWLVRSPKDPKIVAEIERTTQEKATNTGSYQDYLKSLHKPFEDLFLKNSIT